MNFQSWRFTARNSLCYTLFIGKLYFIWHGPSNNFVENPRKFPGIFHRKIRWKCRQLFRGISCNPFQGNSHNSKEILVTNSKAFLVTNSEKNKHWRKCRQNLWKFLGISSEKFFRKIPGNFLGTIPKIFSRVPQDFLYSH